MFKKANKICEKNYSWYNFIMEFSVRKIKFRLFIFTVFFSLQFVYLSATDFSYNFLKRYVSKIWTTADGLPGNTITDVIQDSRGIILLGTYDGLVFFDGIEFDCKNRGNDSNFNFVSARSIFQDSKENIWIGSNDKGITVLSNSGKIFYLDTGSGLPNNSIRAFCEDKEGNVWVGTASGLVYITPDFKVTVPKGIDCLPKDNIYLVTHLYSDTKGRVWFTSSEENGTFFYEDEAFHYYTGLEHGANKYITCVTQDSDGAYWFGLSTRTAVKVTKNEQKLYDFDGRENEGISVNDIMEDQEHNIWFATDHGVFILTKDGKTVNFDLLHGLVDEKISKIIEDREKNIWLATDRGGVQKLSKAKFRTVSLIRTVNAICEDKFHGVNWLACDNGLVCTKDNELIQNDITKKFNNIRIRHVDMTPDGCLLLSCYESFGQVKVLPNGNIVNWTKKDGLAGNKVRVAKQISNGDLYVGTTTGLSIIDAKTNEIRNITKDSAIKNDYIMCIHEAKDGSVWIGTDGGGVFVLNNRDLIKIYNNTSGLIGNIVFKIYEFGDQVWICTGSGISIITKDGRLHSLNSFSGLGTDSVFQVIYDGKKNIWGTSNKGIFSLKMQDIQDYIEGKKRRLSSKFYNSSDGIDSGGVTSTSKSVLTSNGEIWFTLIDGYCVLNTKVDDGVLPKPLVQVRSIQVDSETYAYFGKPYIFPSSIKRLSISYSGLSYISPEKVTYKTKLEGFDSDFSVWTQNRSVSYTNLKPGNYKFYVMAQNADDIESDVSEPFDIIIRPTLFQRWYFWLILALLFLLTLYLIINQRMAYLQRMRLMLENMVHERTKELTDLKNNLEKQVVQRTKELNDQKNKVQILSTEITNALVSTIDAKDKYTNGHSKRVAKYSGMLAEKLGKSEDEISMITYAGLLHDIGKIGVPDTIINKKDKLTDEEWEIVKEHPVKGFEILESIESMPEIRYGARWHHERYDGKGYPDHIAGEEIPEIARIICVADSYDAMTSNRSYRKYLAQDVVREQIANGKGTQFDPLIADKMLEIIDADTEYKYHE